MEFNTQGGKVTDLGLVPHWAFSKLPPVEFWFSPKEERLRVSEKAFTTVFFFLPIVVVKLRFLKKL